MKLHVQNQLALGPATLILQRPLGMYQREFFNYSQVNQEQSSIPSFGKGKHILFLSQGEIPSLEGQDTVFKITSLLSQRCVKELVNKIFNISFLTSSFICSLPFLSSPYMYLYSLPPSLPHSSSLSLTPSSSFL